MNVKRKINLLVKKRIRAFRVYTRVSQTTYIMIIAGIVGILAGFGAVGFRMLISFFQNLSIGSTEKVVDALISLPWYVKLIVPVIGGAIVGPMVYFFAREAKGHGVPEVMQDVALKNGVIRPRIVLVKSLASAITIGTGGSVGREGPIVQIGSAIGSTIGQWIKVSPEQLKVLVGCGAAAGIAATFNAPIAGAFFALEVILGNFALLSFSPIIISSVLATAVSRAFLGDNPAFIVPAYSLVSVWEILLYVVLGIIAGAVSVAFTRLVYQSEDFFDSISIPEYWKTPIGGFVMGILIIFVPYVYGVGYEAIDDALAGNMIWYMALFLIFIKLFATSITIGSGGSGGIFAPSLFLGAVTGSAFGNFVRYLFPNVTADSGAYAMVGMGAVVAGATHAPITSILILFELTSDYKIILALMIACTISTIMARKLFPSSIYTMKLKRRGISLNQGREEIIMKSFSVGDVMKAGAPIIDECTSFNEIIKIFMQNKEPYYYIVDKNKELLGVLSTHVVKSVLYDSNLQNLVIARDLADSPVVMVNINDNLAECMEVFSRVAYEHLPVVQGNGSIKLLGSISRRDILELYNREILRKEVLGLKVVREIGDEKARSHVALPKEYKVDYVPLPESFINKSIRELDIRAKYNITIIAIKKRLGGITGISEVPSANSRFEEGDILIIVGKEKDVEDFKRGLTVAVS